MGQAAVNEEEEWREGIFCLSTYLGRLLRKIVSEIHIICFIELEDFDIIQNASAGAGKCKFIVGERGSI